MFNLQFLLSIMIKANFLCLESIDLLLVHLFVILIHKQLKRVIKNNSFSYKSLRKKDVNINQKLFVLAKIDN